MSRDVPSFAEICRDLPSRGSRTARGHSTPMIRPAPAPAPASTRLLLPLPTPLAGLPRRPAAPAKRAAGLRPAAAGGGGGARTGPPDGNHPLRSQAGGARPGHAAAVTFGAVFPMFGQFSTMPLDEPRRGLRFRLVPHENRISLLLRGRGLCTMDDEPTYRTETAVHGRRSIVRARAPAARCSQVSHIHIGLHRSEWTVRSCAPFWTTSSVLQRLFRPFSLFCFPGFSSLPQCARTDVITLTVTRRGAGRSGRHLSVSPETRVYAHCGRG